MFVGWRVGFRNLSHEQKSDLYRDAAYTGGNERLRALQLFTEFLTNLEAAIECGFKNGPGREAMMRWMSSIADAVLLVTNQPQHLTASAQVTLQVNDNCSPIVNSYISTEETAQRLLTTYGDAFPYGGIPFVQRNRSFLLATSRYLQQSIWPYCPKEEDPCTMPNKKNQPDITVSFLENMQRLPPNQQGYPLFQIPILVVEVEGDKDAWGKMEQESEAMYEVVNTLAFMPEMFLVFVYSTRFEFWKAERDHTRSLIKVESEVIPFNCDQMNHQFRRIVQLVVECLVKQLTRGVSILEDSILYARGKGLTHTSSRYSVRKDIYCCPDCFHLPDIKHALNVLDNNNPNIPPFEQ